MAASLTARDGRTRGPRTWASWTTSPCQCASSASYATLERTREEETERFNVPVHQRTCTSHALHILDASPRRPSPSSSTSADHDRSRMRRRHSGMPIAYTLRPDTCVTRNMMGSSTKVDSSVTTHFGSAVPSQPRTAHFCPATHVSLPPRVFGISQEYGCTNVLDK